jgi:hypothetical protein
MYTHELQNTAAIGSIKPKSVDNCPPPPLPPYTHRTLHVYCLASIRLHAVSADLQQEVQQEFQLFGEGTHGVT